MKLKVCYTDVRFTPQAGNVFHDDEVSYGQSFLLLAESHASLHAWPEYGYCAIDLFTCAIGKDMMPLIQRIKEAFGAESFALRKFDREAEVETQPIPISV